MQFSNDINLYSLSKHSKCGTQLARCTNETVLSYDPLHIEFSTFPDFKPKTYNAPFTSFITKQVILEPHLIPAIAGIARQRNNFTIIPNTFRGLDKPIITKDYVLRQDVL